jgi:hypothetical protein
VHELRIGALPARVYRPASHTAVAISGAEEPLGTDGCHRRRQTCYGRVALVSAYLDHAALLHGRPVTAEPAS